MQACGQRFDGFEVGSGGLTAAECLAASRMMRSMRSCLRVGMAGSEVAMERQ